MAALSTALCMLGIALGCTFIWYPLFRAVASRLDIGPRMPSGKLRHINMIDWLNAAGLGIFAAQILIMLGLSLGQ